MPSAEEERWHGDVADGGEPARIIESVPRFEGRVWSVRSDRIDILGHQVQRDFIVHPGAVAVIALDADSRVLLIRQYRHPVGRWLFEPPAGLLDEPGEDPLTTAARELAEEAGLTAQDWHVLLDLLTSPGGSSEGIRIYLARHLAPLPGGRRATAEAEESVLPQAWIPLEEAVELVLSGLVQSPSAVSGILAAAIGRSQSWSGLRAAESPWRMREHLADAERLHAPDA